MSPSIAGSALLLLMAAQPAGGVPSLEAPTQTDVNAPSAATSIPLLRDFGPSSLPIHAARDPAKYLVEELLLRRLDAFSSRLAQPTNGPSFRFPSQAPLAGPAGLETDATQVSFALLRARLQLASVKAQSTGDNPDVAALSERVTLLERRVAALRAAGESVDAATLKRQRRQIRAEFEAALERAEKQDTPENPQLEQLRQRQSALKPLLK